MTATDPCPALVVGGPYAGCKVAFANDDVLAICRHMGWHAPGRVLDGDLAGRLVEIDPADVREIKATNEGG